MNMDAHTDDDTVAILPPKGLHWFPIGAAILSAVGGLLFGYDTGVISGAMIQLRQQFALSYLNQEVIVSITLASAALSALISASLTDRFGRKPIIILASFIFTTGAIVLGVAGCTSVLLVGRLIVGLGIGMASMTVPIYIAEISPTRLRGALVTLNTVCITAGQMLASIVDGIFMYDQKNGWRYMLGLGGVPSAIQFIGFLVMPETPRWLVQHGRFSDAESVLLRIHGESEPTPEVSRELAVMIEASSPYPPVITSSTSHTENDGRNDDPRRDHTSYHDRMIQRQTGELQSHLRGYTICRMLRQASTRRALLIGCGLQLFQQLVGINTVMYYSASIISMAGVGSISENGNRESTVVWIAAAVASANFFFCSASLCFITRLKRRTLLLASLIGVFLSLLLLGTSFQLIAITSTPVTIVEPVQIKPVQTQCMFSSTCDHCTRSTTCGFCYQMEHGYPVNGSCLPAQDQFSQVSSYGRCSNQSAIQKGLTWAIDHCPTQHGWLTVVGLILYLASFAPGMASLPWTINSELYPTWARSTGVACSTAVNWLSNIVVSLTFLSMTEAITRQGTYFFYAAISLFALLFAYKCVPETGDISLEQTSEITTAYD